MVYHKDCDKCLWLGVIIIVLISGCGSQDDKGQPESGDEIPAHLRDTENLIVYPSDTEPLNTIRFEKDLTFSGDGDIDTYIGNLDNIAVDEQDRLYVYSGKKIHVFESDGSHLTTMGREGDGPGEFRSFVSIQPIIHSNQLYVFDDQRYMINIYSLETLSSSGSILMDPANWQRKELQGYRPTPLQYPQFYFIRNDNTLLMSFRQPFSSEMFGSVPSGNALLGVLLG